MKSRVILLEYLNPILFAVHASLLSSSACSRVFPPRCLCFTKSTIVFSALAKIHSGFSSARDINVTLTHL